MNININRAFRRVVGGAPYEAQRVIRHGRSLVEVVARGEGEAQTFQPGDKIKVDVGGAMRSYTPSLLTPTELRFIGVVHGEGLGSAWLDALRPGDPIRFFGPARSLKAAPSDVEWAGFFGDETTLGAAEALMGALPSGVRRFGALEVNEDSALAVERLGLPLTIFPRVRRGEALLRFAQTLEVPRGDGVLWLSGEASSLVPLKEKLIETGFRRNQMCIKPYWSVKGKGHRKALERGALR